MGGRTYRRTQAVFAGAVTATVLVGTYAAHAALEHPRVVQEQPSETTPHVLDGAVNDFAQIGDTMIAGGEFTQVQDPEQSHTYARQNIMAFDVDTGAVTSFAPQVNGTVWALAPSADGGVYVAGRFTSVDGIPTRGLFKWDLSNGEVDPEFEPVVTRGRVSDVQLVNGRLFVSGWFERRLVALDPETGADTGYLDLEITGDIGPPTDGWPGQVYRFAVNPQHTQMVVIGNFTAIDGVGRRQIAMIDLADEASLATWYSSRWDQSCVRHIPWYTRDVDWSPDGTYFVVVTTGLGFPRTPKLCDTTSKWIANDGSGAQPAWVNHTGGNTLHSVAATGPAVYVGGHQQWLDNPLGNKTKGPGAVDRPGIGAIDPETGRALAWNPTKGRGQGAKALYVTPEGMWVGSDTDQFAGQFRARIAFVPL